MPADAEHGVGYVETHVIKLILRARAPACRSNSCAACGLRAGEIQVRRVRALVEQPTFLNRPMAWEISLMLGKGWVLRHHVDKKSNSADTLFSCGTLCSLDVQQSTAFLRILIHGKWVPDTIATKQISRNNLNIFFISVYIRLKLKCSYTGAIYSIFMSSMFLRLDSMLPFLIAAERGPPSESIVPEIPEVSNCRPGQDSLSFSRSNATNRYVRVTSSSIGMRLIHPEIHRRLPLG